MPVSQAHALMELLWSPGVSQTELSQSLGLSKSNVSRLVRRLEERGQLRRVPDPADGRVSRVELTRKGEELARALDLRSRDRFSRLLDAVPAGRRGQVLEALELLVAAVPETGRAEHRGGSGDG